jgi:hypothetical protein
LDVASFAAGMCANFKDMLGYMGSCRILRNTHVPCLQTKDHFYI